MDEMRQLSEELGRLRTTINAMQERRQGTNSATVTVNASGLGLVIALCGFFLALAVAIGCGFAFLSSKQDISRQDQKIERMQDYLQNIYQQAPWLKPKDQK